MKLGFLTSNVNDILKARAIGFDAVELGAKALGNPSEAKLDQSTIARAGALCEENDIEITALAYYNSPPKPPNSRSTLKEYRRVFDAAEALDVRVVACMAGYDADLSWGANIQLWADRFGPVAELAEQRGVKIAFENWMGCPGTILSRPVNAGGCPDLWDAWFKAVKSKALGIEFDPSHLYWQGIDYLRAAREYAKRIYHVHAKDTEMLPEPRYRRGAMARTFRFRIPGYGEIDWPQFISTLVEGGYRGGVAIEHEDPVFSGKRFDEGLERGLDMLKPLIK